MKGFGIEIKNDLLDPKHVDSMGQAVWLYMWLIDKMTSIDEEGVGKVLGGKPIKFDEVKAELGISQDTYTRWIDKLSGYPYIEAIRTPYGISFRVFKAYKHFGKRIRTNAESTSAEPRNLLRKNAESNKTVSVDSTVDITQVFLKPEKLIHSEVPEMSYAGVDEDGEELPSRDKKVKIPKVSKSKVALGLQKKFADMCQENLSMRPVVDTKGYYTVLFAMNKGGLTEQLIIQLFEEWFTERKLADDKLAQITWALSGNNITAFKARNQIE